MPKKAKELSGLVVSRLKSEGMYAVGGVDGLYPVSYTHLDVYKRQVYQF